MDFSLRYSVLSDSGLRPNNEDAAFAGPRLLALADGVGGHAAGEIAASIVISELAPLDREHVSDPVSVLSKAVARANAAIARHVEEHPEHRGMATTLTAILFAGDHLGLVHIGDSRAYLLRDGSLTQITRDDSLLQSLIESDRIAPEEAWGHPQRAMVLKVLNGETIDPFLDVRNSRPGDRYLICSDGLSDYVQADSIREMMTLREPQSCTQELIRLAFMNQSQDNVTCIVAEVVEGDSLYDIAIATTGTTGVTARLSRVG
jgi:protein phosphatase